MPALETASVRARIYDPLKEALVGVKNVVEYGKPEDWGYGTARQLVRLRRRVHELPPEAQEFVISLYPIAVSLLRSSPPVPQQDGMSEKQWREAIGTGRSGKCIVHMMRWCMKT